MHAVLTLKLNDAAARALGVTNDPPGEAPSGPGLSGCLTSASPTDLGAGLQQRIDRGLVRRGSVLTWADSVGSAEDAPSPYVDLTEWECADSSFHIEDLVPVDVATVDGTPLIAAGDQRTLLVHGLAFALQLSRLVSTLDPPRRVRCIVGANDTNATFRFHQIRPDEHWNVSDLDSYQHDKMIVLDIEPGAS